MQHISAGVSMLTDLFKKKKKQLKIKCKKGANNCYTADLNDMIDNLNSAMKSFVCKVMEEMWPHEM